MYNTMRSKWLSRASLMESVMYDIDCTLYRDVPALLSSIYVLIII